MALGGLGRVFGAPQPGWGLRPLSPQPTFLVELSKVLANPGNSQVARVAAGLQIKNSLTSKDPDIKAQYQQRWLAIDANARREVKNFVSPSAFPVFPTGGVGEESCPWFSA